MTIAALRALLDELLPDVQRPPAPRVHLHHDRPLPSKDPTMDTPRPASRPAAAAGRLDEPAPAPAPDVPEDADLPGLLAWADAHCDASIKQCGAPVRRGVLDLLGRRAADEEISQIDTETEQLRQRLAQLEARRNVLTPKRRGRRGRRGAPAPEHTTAEVREWARRRGLEVPATGRVPRRIYEMWEQENQESTR